MKPPAAAAPAARRRRVVVLDRAVAEDDHLRHLRHGDDAGGVARACPTASATSAGGLVAVRLAGATSLRRQSSTSRASAHGLVSCPPSGRPTSGSWRRRQSVRVAPRRATHSAYFGGHDGAAQGDVPLLGRPSSVPRRTSALRVRVRVVPGDGLRRASRGRAACTSA